MKIEIKQKGKLSNVINKLSVVSFNKKQWDDSITQACF